MAMWTALSLFIAAAGLVVFAVPVLLRHHSFSVKIGLVDVLIVVVLALVVSVVHEAIHGAVMRVFGAKAQFGAVMVAGAIPALYTTAAGHLFTRGQYLTVALAPALLISVVGFAACFTVGGGYLILPLALHLGGCTGDFMATREVLCEGRGTMCEDLRDGVRFHRPPA
jgi:hypothetical protein